MSQHTTKVSQPADAGGAHPTEKTIPDTPAAAIPLSSWRPAMLVQAARGEKIFVKVPVLGAVDQPSGPHLVWFAGAFGLAALDVVDWPIALLLIVGKALSDSERSEPVRTLGKIMERV
jgi:hypothetical protein